MSAAKAITCLILAVVIFSSGYGTAHYLAKRDIDRLTAKYQDESHRLSDELGKAVGLYRAVEATNRGLESELGRSRGYVRQLESELERARANAISAQGTVVSIERITTESGNRLQDAIDNLSRVIDAVRTATEIK